MTAAIDTPASSTPCAGCQLKPETVETRALARIKRIKQFIWATAGVVLTSVLGTAGTITWAQSRIDGGVAPVQQFAAQQVAAQQQALTEHKSEELARYIRLERKVDEGQHRLDSKMDALLMKFGVPNPAPTPGRDGGAP